MSTTDLPAGAGGDWKVTAPDGVTVTPTLTNGVVSGLDINIDYTQADFNGPNGSQVELTFTGPVTDPSGKPVIPGFYNGLVIDNTTIEVKNDLGATINGFSYMLTNEGSVAQPPKDTTGVDPHPDDYAHMHNLTMNSLVDAATGKPNASLNLSNPDFQPAGFGPPMANVVAPSFISADGTIAPGATEKLVGSSSNGGFILHSEDTPGPDGGSFLLDFWPQATTPTPTPTPTPSPSPTLDGTVIYANGSITDANHNVWTIQNGQVAVNGNVDPTTANVVNLAYEKGAVWQKNTDNNWWFKNSPSDQWTFGGDPTLAHKIVSPDNTEVTQPDQWIVDAAHDTWAIQDGQVAVNGIIDNTTANVIDLLYKGGQVWQENSDDLWWSKTSPSDTWNPPAGQSQHPAVAATMTLADFNAAPSVATSGASGGADPSQPNFAGGLTAAVPDSSVMVMPVHS